MKPMIWSVAAAAVVCLSAPAAAQVNTSRAGAYGEVTLESGFMPDPHTVALTAGGTVEAGSVSSDCVGMIANRADFTLRYRDAGDLPLIFSATSDADTTLAIRAPDGRWYCDDDSAGALNPMVRFDSPRDGRYQIWVGTYGPDAAPAALHISEIGAQQADGPDWSLEPAYGAIELAAGFMPDPHTQEIAAGGSIDASVVAPQCVGWIARAPDYRLHWTSGSNELPLVISVASEADTTLVINGPDTSWHCDDDGGNEGLNPAITFESPASGQYDIWVGTYMSGELQASTLHISELYAQ